MSRSLFSINTFAPLIIGLAFLNSPVLGQTVSSPVVVPSAEETAPGRPTLKQRQPPPRNSSSLSVSDQQPPEKEEFGNRDISPNEVNEPKVRFEGLHAFAVAKMLKLFRERGVWSQKDGRSASAVLAAALTVLKESLEARGYLQASVEARQHCEANAIVFLVSEGPRFSIGEIRFEGTESFHLRN